MTKNNNGEFDRARKELLVQHKDLLTFLADAGLIVHCDATKDRVVARAAYKEMNCFYEKYQNPNMKIVLNKAEEIYPYLKERKP